VSRDDGLDDITRKRIGRRPGGLKPAPPPAPDIQAEQAAAISETLQGAFSLPRPYPPMGRGDDGGMVLPGSLTPATVDEYRPAPELRDWALATFIGDGSDLANPDHSHLRFARVAWLWTNQAYTRQGRKVAGRAEQVQTPANKWTKGQRDQQLREWFGTWWSGQAPDFLVIIDACVAASLSDVDFCALIEHECYHMAQSRDEYGAPEFYASSGLPKLSIRAHDVEEFVGVIARYGAGVSANVDRLVKAALDGPSVGAASVAAACGTANCGVNIGVVR
jgi:Putative phage metallopeptidase